MAHLHDELAANPARVVVETRFGPVTGGRATNGAAVFLELPYALPPRRFDDALPLPGNYRYEPGKEYITESSYCFQPHNDGQARDTPFKDKVGYGEPTENPLFLNIVCPPSFLQEVKLDLEEESEPQWPVKVYIHGGFLQFGSPHGLKGQEQYVSAERHEVRVNIGYRVSAFGFLACDGLGSGDKGLDGNYGFKDQWLALEWIKRNIGAFGGDPQDITILGLSAGAHAVHQILHYVSHLPEGAEAPFRSALLMSNAIVPVAQLRPQFEAFCRALHLDPHAPNIIETLRDPKRVPASKICEVIETDALGTKFGTFRGCTDGKWLSAEPDVMAWQRSGDFASNLVKKGVKSVVVGDLTEEWYLYSIAHPIRTKEAIKTNLQRYFEEELVERMLGEGLYPYPEMGDDADEEDYVQMFGEILSDWQAHLPVRLLARDLHNAEFPVLRYEIAWTPEEKRPEGYVTHGSDSILWHFRVPDLKAEQLEIARSWLSRIQVEVKQMEERGSSGKGERDILRLSRGANSGSDSSSGSGEISMEWVEDGSWEEKMKLARILA